MRATSQRLTNRQRGVLLATAAATALTFFDQTGTTAALHQIGRDLDASISELQWVMASYLLALAALVPASGRLADILGRRRLFLAGVALFGTASLACAVAPTIGILIAMRALQGVGGALVVPLALANVAATFPETHRGWAIGVLATGGSTFLSLGPLIGGALVDTVGWRWVFAVSLPVAVLSVWAGARWIDESRAPVRPALDGIGLLLLAVGLGAVVTGLLQIDTWGATAPATLGAVGCGTAILIAWATVEHDATDPVIAVRLVRIPRVAAALVALLVGQFAVTAVTVELMLYLQRALGYGAFAAGMFFLPTVLATPLLSPAAGRLADQGRARLLVTGGLLAAAGALLWICALAGQQSAWLLLPAFALFGLSRPFFFTPSSRAPVSVLPPAEQATAAALVTEAYQLGAVLGVAVAGSVVSSAGVITGLQVAMAVSGSMCLMAAAATRILLVPARLDPAGVVRPRSEA